ncbi:tetratricopeptide repeat protein [Singulisphaera sp. Ch08]|uniref:Tetratricopeptide repeat protein n=1 Tax=Singulisphaera sp. Ch08 TaxID=3120278 RepID=A0AAU7C823_9BACT
MKDHGIIVGEVDADRKPRISSDVLANLFLGLGGGCLVAFAIAAEIGKPLAWLVVLGIGFLILSHWQRMRLIAIRHQKQFGLLDARVQHLEKGINALVESRQRALMYWVKTKGPGSLEVAESLFHLAFIKSDLGNNDEAEPLYRGALEIWENVLGPESEEVAGCLSNLAKLYEEEGEYSEAEPLYHRALAIREKVLGTEHLEVEFSLNNLTFFYHQCGDYDQAEHFQKRVLAARELRLGPEDPDHVVHLEYYAVYCDVCSVTPRLSPSKNVSRRSHQ